VRRGSSDEGGKASLWEAWGIQGLDIPPVQAAPEALIPKTLADVEEDERASLTIDFETPEVEALPVSAPAPDESLGAPTSVALDKKARIIPHAIDSTIVEYYRRLRTKIIQKREEQGFRTLLVTSANPQEGKTVTSLNLGLSFAMLPSFKVLVIDGDLRRGSLGNWLGIPPSQPGLSNLVDGSARLEDVVLKSEAVPMHFMVRGNSKVPDAHPSQFEVHFRRLAECFDLILVDSPPVNLLADVQLLARCSEAVLLVARSFVTSRQALEKAVQELQPYNVIGTVLNASSVERSKRYYGYYGPRA
jgi:succinoglycan biosynthesis transport protein ExoP